MRSEELIKSPGLKIWPIVGGAALMAIAALLVMATRGCATPIYTPIYPTGCP